MTIHVKKTRFAYSRLFLSAACLAAAVLAAASFAWCADDEKEGRPVVSVEIRNNRAVSSETILAKIKTQRGGVFNQQTLNDDLKRLYATDYFLDVVMDAKAVTGGVAVTITVEEKPVIATIVFKGNKVFSASKLKATMKSKENEILNHALLTQDTLEIRRLYEKKGYNLVDVKYDFETDRATNKTTVSISIDEKIRVRVAKITITGNKAIKTGRIRKLLSTKPAWLFNVGAFQEDLFQEDLERIRALYADEGYLDAQASPKIDYSPDGTQMYITIEIAEGKKYLVGEISLRGNIVLPEKDVAKKLKMKPPKAFSAKALREDVLSLIQYYNHFGYMNAVVDVARNLNAQTGNIDIVYNIDAKDIVYVGKVNVKGNIKTKDIVIRRELRIYPGERFDGDKIRRSKERLYNLGFFEDVSFDTEQTKEEGIQDLTVTVKEAKTGEFSFGGGYSSIDFLIGFVSVTQRNFDIVNFPTFVGGGQNLTLKAEFGMVRQNYLISWTDPWFLGCPFSFGFDLYRTSHDKKLQVGYGYEETRTGGDLRVGKEFTDNLKTDCIYRLEEIKIASVNENASSDLANEQGSKWISSVAFAPSYDTRDNVFNPTRGWFATCGAEYAGGVIGGNKDFVKFTGSASYYRSFFEKIVLELKAYTGIASAYGKTKQVPIYERFFSGGANSIRGYGERMVSPRDPGSNDPVGGEGVFVGNAEVTFPIFERLLKGAVFYDMGNTWRYKRDYGTGHLRSGTGVGVRVKTPIGPLKLDYGWPLSANYDDKREGQFYFSVSHGF